MRTRLWLAVCLTLAVILVLAGSLGATTYYYHSFGHGTAFGINEGGQVVGYSSSTNPYAFLWTAPGPKLNLGTLGGDKSYAQDINNYGQVVGEAETSSGNHNPFFWSSSQGMIDLGTLGTQFPYVDTARGINDNCQVVGESHIPGHSCAFLWTPSGGMQDLGTLGGNYAYAYDINNCGQVVGFSTTKEDTETIKAAVNPGEYAFLWTPSGGMQNLGTLGGRWSHAKGINELGQVVGRAQLGEEEGISENHAFLWDGDMQDLGTLGGGYSKAISINDQCHVVGEANTAGEIYHRAFLWTPSWGMQDLNDFVLNPPEGDILETACDINNWGQIVGHTRGWKAFLLTPLNCITPPSKWTFMVYMAGDNDLEDAAIDDFLQMANVPFDADINIIVQFDRIPDHSSDYDDWTTCKRFRIISCMTPTAANALDDLGECDMGDPETLTNFINWATSNYPASNYALILWNHGSGWLESQKSLLKALQMAKTVEERVAIEKKLETIKKRCFLKSVCHDDTNAGNCLYMKDVKSALNNATTHMDLIGFDACFMGMIEVAHEIKDTGATVMVGSEDEEPNRGWPYDTILTGLTSNLSWTPSQLGSWIVDKYYRPYVSYQTMSAIDLNHVASLSAKVSDLANALQRDWNSSQATVKTVAQAVMAEINQTVINEKHGVKLPGAHGLAIYFPRTAADFDSDYNSATIDFPGDTAWEEFLADFYQFMQGSFINVARGQTQQFLFPENVDLYDFCEKLVNAKKPLPCLPWIPLLLLDD